MNFFDVVVGTSLVYKIENYGSIDKVCELFEAHISNWGQIAQRSSLDFVWDNIQPNLISDAWSAT